MTYIVRSIKSLPFGYWNYRFKRIDIIMSDMLDYDTIKVYGMNNELMEESQIKKGSGIGYVHDCVMKHFDDTNKPEVYVKTIVTKIIEHKLEM